MALTDKLKAIADAIRSKTGKTEEMTIDKMSEEISWMLDASKLIDGSIVFANIPNGTIKIKQSEFDKCERLTSVTIPSSVTSIESYAFRNCTGLTDIIIPDSVTNIGEMAFSGCGLTSITIPGSVTNANANGIFFNCKNLTSVTYIDGVTSINGLENCTGLTSVIIPNSVTTIFDGAFRGCTGLTSVTIPNSVTTMGGLAFSNCTSLATVNIPKSLNKFISTYYGYVFQGSTALENVTLENGFNTDTIYLGLDSSTKYSVETLVAMMEALTDRTGESTQYTLKIGSTNKNKLSAEQQAIATNKNWTIT